MVTEATESNLRAALTGGGTVTFAVSGTITLTDTIVVTSNTEIDASGHAVVLSGGGAVRVMTINPGVQVTLKHLTVADGYDTNEMAGCGGIFSRAAALTVIACTFSNNVGTVAPDGNGALRQWDGGLLTVVGSTFVNNRGSGSAGAIDTGFLSFTDGVRLTNCTFYGNSGSVGAVLVREPIARPSWMVNCSVAWNTNLFDAAVKETTSTIPSDARLTLLNTLVAHSVGGISGLGFVDGGHNLSSDNSPVFDHANSYKNTDPLLGPLADNGGPTWTLALQPGSPAINNANANAAPATDQRGLLRPYGDGSDVGAFEVAPPFVIQGHVGGVTLTNQVSISINGNTMTTTNGWFGLVGQSVGAYTITPMDANYVFVPTNQTVALGPDQLSVNFTAYRRNTLSLDSLALGLVDLVYAGTNAQLVRVLVSTNGADWYPLATNNVGENHVLEISTPAEGPMRLYRTERIQ